MERKTIKNTAPASACLAIAGLIFAGLALDASFSSQAAAQVLQPHEALYEVELAESRGSNALSDASGLIGFEWQASCEAYSTSQRFYTRFVTTEGLSTTSDIVFSATEQMDGSSFSFDMADSVNGHVVEHRVGEASEGQLSFTLPDPQSGDLPPGTIFPTQQSARLIASALAGQRYLETRIFDGGAEDEVYDTVARIDPVEGIYLPHPESSGSTSLMSLQSWHITMSYYDIGAEATTPNYEISYRLFSNGIVDELRMDYGDYVFFARMMQLDLLDQPSC